MAKITVSDLLIKFNNKQKISMVTAYDYAFASLVDQANMDIVLVGDSLGVVIQGCENTLSVTLDEMIYHTKIVSKGLKRSFLVADMPFMSYQASSAEALSAAGALIKHGCAQAVKLEGGKWLSPVIRKMIRSGIPVMGHIGLMPQTYHTTGGYKLQGKSHSDRERIIGDAKALNDAGCFSIVLECIPENLGHEITEQVSIPTIGIGAGRFCSGQVLVLNDLLGLKPPTQSATAASTPKFVKAYAQLGREIIAYLQEFVKDVGSGSYPDDTHTYK